MLLAQLCPTWRSATLLVQPETILRWHRQAFELFWRRKSKRAGAPPRIGADTIALIETMASKNRLWGAERIRGELLKLNVRVAKRTIQRYMRRVRQPRPRRPVKRSGGCRANHPARGASGRDPRQPRSGQGQAHSARGGAAGQ